MVESAVAQQIKQHGAESTPPLQHAEERSGWRYLTSGHREIILIFENASNVP